MRKVRKYISLILSVLLISNIIHIQTATAAGNEPGTEIIVDSKQTLEKEHRIIAELSDKREIDTKHFIRDDFTYEADVYPYPVHYYKDGKWQDIDNSLVEKAEGSEINLENKDNDFKVKFSKNSNSNKLIKLSKDKYEISWNLEGAQKVKASADSKNDSSINSFIEKRVDSYVNSNKKYKNASKDELEEAKVVLTANEKEKTLSKVESGVTYADILTGTDLQYSLQGNSLKENIIIKEKQENPSYTFILNTKNLSAKLNADSTVSLFDDKDTSKEVFKFNAPFMYDADKDFSNAVEVSLEKVKGGYTLTMKPDSSWLNSEDRQYPVVIDPYTYTSLGVNDIKDSYVNSGQSSTNYYQQPFLATGRGNDNTLNRSYVQFASPQLKPSEFIIHADLKLSLYAGDYKNRQVNVHAVNSNWNSSTINWSNKPDYDQKIIDYNLINGAAYSEYTWDITEIAKKWNNPSGNFGVIIKDNDEGTMGYNRFISSEAGTAIPYVNVYYVEYSGLESYWTYHQQDAGRAGLGFVNDFKGNLTFIHDDLTMNGSKMPISLKHVYNSNYYGGSTGFGYGWRLNLTQTVTPVTISGIQYYSFIDEDGTNHYFSAGADGVIKDEAGLNLTLTKNADGTYTITDDKDNKRFFQSNGCLKQIKDSNGNTLTLNYYDKILISVVDGAGRTTVLNYEQNTASSSYGFLKEVIDPSGRKTSYGYTNKQLTSITYPDNKTVSYSYDANNNLLSAQNIDGYKVSYSYYPGLPAQVKNISENASDGTLGGEVNIVYGNNITSFTDYKGRTETYEFNNYGNTLGIIDSLGRGQYYSYIHDSKAPAKNNRLQSQSNLQTTVINYIRNSSAETSSDWGLTSTGTSTGSGIVTSEASYIGNSSLKVSKTNSSDIHYYSQAVSLKKGETYNLSAYIKTQGISNINGAGAQVFVTYQDASGSWQRAESGTFKGTQNWQRAEASFTLPSEAVSNTVWASVGIKSETGIAYFDAVQLSQGYTAGRYNLIENSDFTYGGSSPTGWVRGGQDDGGDFVITDAGTHPSSMDKISYQLSGAATKQKSIYQYINANGVKGDNFIIGAWAKANSVPIGSAGKNFAVHVGFYDYTSGTFSWEEAAFNADSKDWQYISKPIIAPKNYNVISVQLSYYNNANTVLLDGIQLYKEEFGQSYTYDDKGRVTQVSDVANKNSAFLYTDNGDLSLATDAKSSKFAYVYDYEDPSLKEHNLTKATSAEGVIYDFSYDNSGNSLTSKISSVRESKAITGSAIYSSTENYISSVTDSAGSTVSYVYDEIKGVLDTVTDPMNKTTSYLYYPNDDALETVYKSKGNETIANNYSYENDRIKTIEHNNGLIYSFDYDVFGNNKSVKVGNNQLINNVYDSKTGLLTSSNYGNGQYTWYSYDNLDRLNGLTYNGVSKYTYVYDGMGNLGFQWDIDNNVGYKYSYDLSNRLANISDTNGNESSYSYDLNNNLSGFNEKINGNNYGTSYEYNKDNQLNKVSYFRNSSSNISYGYDGLGRLKDKVINTGSPIYNTSYLYYDGASGSTTTRVQSISNNNNKIEYTYYPDGNIRTITSGGNTITYVYDELGELKREDNPAADTTVIYSYDAGGNIKTRDEYKYNSGVPTDLKQSYKYEYTDSNWKDKLTKFNNMAISYDSIGNPLSYNGLTFSWQKGRELAGISGNGKNITYKYNDGGIRTEKNVNGVITKYRVVDGKVTFESNGTDYIYYTYSSDDNLVSMNLNGTEYYYIRNAQNDIIGLIDKAGTQVVSYSYDTWGKLISVTGILTSTVGAKNPYRYRGYRYDTETGLYYLQSRYYNPEFGRFINADAVAGKVGELLGHNIFAYCKNNPINKFDSDGFRTTDNLPLGGDGGAGGGGAAELWGLYQLAKFGAQKAAQLAEKSSEKIGVVASKVKPTQIHHFLTDKSKVFTNQFQSITEKYGLKLNDAWNKAAMPHQGRHPNAYHEYVLEKITQFDIASKGDVNKFLNLFEQLKQEILINPDMLIKKYWK